MCIKLTMTKQQLSVYYLQHREAEWKESLRQTLGP